MSMTKDQLKIEIGRLKTYCANNGMEIQVIKNLAIEGIQSEGTQTEEIFWIVNFRIKVPASITL